MNYPAILSLALIHYRKFYHFTQRTHTYTYRSFCVFIQKNNRYISTEYFIRLCMNKYICRRYLSVILTIVAGLMALTAKNVRNMVESRIIDNLKTYDYIKKHQI